MREARGVLNLFYCGFFKNVFIHLVSFGQICYISTNKANQNKMWIQAETGEAFRVKTKREGELIKEIS